MPRSDQSEKRSVVQQIETVEGSIALHEKKLDEIDRSLRLRELTIDQRDKLENEEKLCKAEMEELKVELRSLRKDNMKSMFLSVVILISIYIIYVLFWS